jgi:glycosyltransferase involved in cell wall biosynthesis
VTAIAPLDKINVALMANDLRPGGAERQLVELARGLDKERFRVLVVTLYPGWPLEQEIEGQEGVRLLTLKRKGKFDFGVLLPLVRLLRREKVHVVQPYLSPATFFALTAGLLARVPVRIVTERCGVRRNTRFGENLYRFAEDRLTRFADAAIANSESGREFLVSRGIGVDKTGVIYNGINAERVTTSQEDVAKLRASLGIAAEAPVIGIVASLTPAKDFPTLLKSARIIRDSVPPVRLLVVGDGPLRGELEAMAAQLGLADSVLFAGHHMRVAPFVGGFDVAVLSSCDYEGCSNYLLEAMGLGRPVVATDIGGNRELVHHGETGLLVPPRDPNALAAAVLTLLHDRGLAKRLTDAAQERFQAGFSVPTMVRQYEELYESLLDRRGIRLEGTRPRVASMTGSTSISSSESTRDDSCT